MTQLALAETPLPAMPYDTAPPHRASETSAEGAQKIAPKVGTLQAKVILALYNTPGLTQPGLDRMLGVEAGRSARPRVTELRLAGLVQECGTCLGEAGIRNTCYELTEAGEKLARELS